MDDLAILIPCYNEGITIGKVVKDCLRDTRDIEGRVNIYVYDNNSKDNTVNEAQTAGAIVRHEYQQGKGNVIRRMFRDIDAKCYILIDGDDTYPTDVIPKMYRLTIERNLDMVVGDRLSSSYFEENKRPFHNIGNRIVRGSINWLFKSNIRDIMTGYRAFSYQFVKSYPVVSKGFEIETDMTIFAIENNMAVHNEIIEYKDRPDGSESKLNTYSDGFKVLKRILISYRDYHPLGFFSIVAMILVAIALFLFIPEVWIPYLQTGLVEKIPTLIVSAFLIIGAIVSWYSGLILDSVLQKEKREFEFRLNLISKKQK
ncbi:glycosyltransferase family 2 protein [Liquorilactobacillus hordei]|uniref:Glycosyl transferase n=1 Tax=Liquorilactobacillus hordei TaxID=468911 RepID=A0A3S6QN93_9LACO|nr:glycosyltransferase family 2 protein [Liquorilactobacillus hordei]AUJ29441.1 glycosyl transferase [Liquorilactobacillus hordei]